MKITNSDAIYLGRVYATLAQKKLPLRAAYKLARLQKALTSELEFYNTRLGSYLDMYAEKTSEGDLVRTDDGGIKIKRDKVDECNRKIQELEEMQIEIADITFTLDELESLEFTVDEMGALLPFINE